MLTIPSIDTALLNVDIVIGAQRYIRCIGCSVMFLAPGAAALFASPLGVTSKDVQKTKFHRGLRGFVEMCYTYSTF
jgi:hypothetical protein